MKLSIIVPVYKVRRYLQSCIESILQQTFIDYELILVDDGSPDSCGAMCDRYAQQNERVKVIHKINGGLSSARNAGLAIAKGEYITFVDGDDMIAPGTFFHNMKILIGDPGIDILEYPVVVHYDSPDSHIVTFTAEKISGNKNIFVDWIKREGYNHCYAWNKIYRSHLFAFTRYPEGEVFEDVQVTPILFENCDHVYYSDGGIYYYYSHPESITRTYTFKSQFELLKNTVTLYNKAKKDYNLTTEANLLLLSCINKFIILLRCRDKSPKYYKEACDMLKSEKITFAELFGMPIKIKQKIKNITFVLFGAKIHCRLVSFFMKRLN